MEQRMGLAHDDFDGILSCALAGCPRPRRWADYPDLPRLLHGFQGELWATEVNDLGLYQRLPRVVLLDHHYSVHRLLGLPAGAPVKAVWDGRGWRIEAAGREPAASMVSGLRQLGYRVPGDLARAGDVLDNLALAETREEWMMVAGYMLLLRDSGWKREILEASDPAGAARRVLRRFVEAGSRVPWGRVEELRREALGRRVGPAPVVVVDEREEGLGRLAALRLEKESPYVVLLRVRSDGTVRGTVVSLSRGDADQVARRLGGGGRRLWPGGSIGGFHAPGLGEALRRLREVLEG